MTSTILNGSGLAVDFDGIHALSGIDVEVARNEILGIIGPNGAGKTTLLNVLTGYQRADRGSVRFCGLEITGHSPERVSAAGLVRTFQAVRPFARLSVFENLEIGAIAAHGSRRRARPHVVSLLKRFGLSGRSERRAEGLPAGELRALGVARALALRPKVLLLDEPAAGMNDEESMRLVDTLIAVRDEYELALVVVEHDMRVIMSLCERIQVLDHGVTIAAGSPADVRADPAVLEAYLGATEDRADG